MKKLIVITGAGVSADSGIRTFRNDKDSLWNDEDKMKMFSITGFRNDPRTAYAFYEGLRVGMNNAEPNVMHKFIADLEHQFDTTIVTHNIDNLHEKAGSTNVLHMHGQINKVRNGLEPNKIKDWEGELKYGVEDKDGFQLRPHIVLFGEEPYYFEEVGELLNSAGIVVIIGMSHSISYFDTLLDLIPEDAKILSINPQDEYKLSNRNVENVMETAVNAIPHLQAFLFNNL